MIKDTRIKKARTNSEVNNCETQLGTRTTTVQLTRIKEWCTIAAEEAFAATKEKQINKFNNLFLRKFARRTLDANKVVKNLSTRPLSEDESKVLALGLNYAVAPRTIPTHSIIAATEATTKQLDFDTAEKLRVGVSAVLQSSKTPRSNLPNHLRKAVKELRSDHTIVVLPADKGNVTVVLDQKDYIEKIENMLKDGAYSRLRKDPTTTVETRVTRLLKKWEKDEHITKKFRLRLQPQCSTPPQLYGLPKIHKEGVPLRPIGSTSGSPTYTT